MSLEQIELLKQQLAEERAARIAAENALKQKRTSDLEGVFENIVDAYLIMDLSGNILKMNESAQQILGFKKDDVGFNLMKMVNPEDYNKVAASFQELLNLGILTNFELKILTNQNIEKIVHINANIIYKEGKPLAAQGIIRDITKDKIAQENLKASENRLQTVILNLDKGILLEDEDRKIVVTNQKFCDFFNISLNPEDMIGYDCREAAKQSKNLFKDPDGFVDNIETILKNRKTVLGEELEMVDGRVLERDYIPVFKDGEYKGHLWAYKDFTAKRKLRENQDQERLKYRNVITNLNLGLVEVDTKDLITVVNDNFLEMSGYNREEIIGKDAKEVFIVNEETLNEQRNNRRKGISNSYEINMKNKRGEDRIWLISAAPNYDVNGEVIGALGMHLDITDLKSLEKDKESLLMALEKSNNELQEYAHIVSHDLKSPLRSINALVNWVKEDNKGKLDEASLQNLNLIDTTLERMEQLISDILTYSSVGFSEKEKEAVNIQEVVHDLIQILYVPEYITIYILKPLPVIIGYKTKLQQLFQNLISNAIKFIDKEKGMIYISFEELDDYYQFSVQDNGMGIEKQFYDKIFKVFHALEKSNDSTGIGLSIVQKIVELHEGKIWLESKPNKGTTFYFTIKK